jgi:hypothetical protein
MVVTTRYIDTGAADRPSIGKRVVPTAGSEAVNGC